MSDVTEQQTGETRGKAMSNCPFCDSPPDIVQMPFDGWVVSCGYDRCDVQPSTNGYHDRNDAIAAWNRRAPAPGEVAEIAERAEFERAWQSYCEANPRETGERHLARAMFDAGSAAAAGEKGEGR